MKERSGLQTPERSGFPDGVRGAGPLGADALRRSAVSIASPCPNAIGETIASAMLEMMRVLNTISPADRMSRGGESRCCDIEPAAGGPATPGNPRRAAQRTSLARGAPWVPSVLCDCEAALR